MDDKSNITPLGLVDLFWLFFCRPGTGSCYIDILYLALPDHLRRIAIIVISLIMIFALLWSFLPTWDSIFGSRLMDLKKIQTLRMPITGEKIPIKWLFASYITLMIVVILRYAWICYEVSIKGPPKKPIEEFLVTQKDDT